MDLMLLLPEILVLGLAVLTLCLDWFLDKEKKEWLGYTTVLGLGAIFLVILICSQKNIFPFAADLTMTQPGGKVVFQGFVFDAFSLFFKEIFLLAACLVSVFSLSYFKKDNRRSGEYYALLLFVTLGCFLLVSASDLLTIFVSFELMSVPLYILTAFMKKDSKSSEAGMKYFLIGAVTSALLAFGMSLVYAAVGSTDIVHLTSPGVISIRNMGQNPVLLFGLFFMLSAFAYKIAAAPFHMWAPDVYEGAPAPVVSLLAIAPKTAVIGLLTRIFLANMSPLQSFWTLMFAILAALSMTIGNLGALHQQNLKRLLAYSGISQMGYILVGFAAAQPISSGNFPSYQSAYQAVLFYVVAYVFTELTAFGVVSYLASEGCEDVASLKGLASRRPATALIFALALLSLAGVPPLVGFVGKFYLFTAAFSAKLYWLVGLALINSVISLFYYLRVCRALYFEKEGAPVAAPSFLMQVAMWVACLGVLAVGIYPAVMVRLSESALVPLAKIFVGF